jgi:hypothetical protein
MSSGTARFAKEIECCRHLNLERRIVLPPLSSNYATEWEAQPKEDAAGPGLTVLADASGLYFVLDLPPTEGLRGQTDPSATVSFTLDARGPDQRGKQGFVDPIEMDVPWEDGRFEIDKPRNAVFGSGYDRELLKKWFLASVNTLPSGRRQVRLSIPRGYFYLHEWNFGKGGQNTLGLNVGVALSEVDPTTGKSSFSIKRTYKLVSPGLAKHDAMGLAVLALDPSASVRWSAVCY